MKGKPTSFQKYSISSSLSSSSSSSTPILRLLCVLHHYLLNPLKSFRLGLGPFHLPPFLGSSQVSRLFCLPGFSNTVQSIDAEQGQDGTLRKISSEELLWRSSVLEDVKRFNPKH